MSKGDVFENDLMKLIFNASPIAYIADDAVTTPLTDLYVSLHIDDPGDAGDQTTNEANYTDYARVAVPRAAVTGWTVTDNAATNAIAVDWPACTGGSSTCTFFAIGTDPTGAGKILYSGAITDPALGLVVSPGITPSAAIGQLSITED